MGRIPGKIKTLPEDFIVHEVPLYDPVGTGEHLYLFVQKTNFSNEEFRQHLRDGLAISDAEIGAAGIKDKCAITRQWISVPRRVEPLLSNIEVPGIKILECLVHENKLRMGHLKGNLFQILIRTNDNDAEAKAQAICKRLDLNGIVNYYGKQRFGASCRNAVIGQQIVLEPKTKRIPRRKQKFYISAWQSEQFNRYLDLREEVGAIHRPSRGDLMVVQESGGLFILDDPEREEEKWRAGVIVPTGPMFGAKMRYAADQPGVWEKQILSSSGVTQEQVKALKKLAPGSRRAILVRPQGLSIKKVSDGVWVYFELPRGAYATTVMEEFLEQPMVTQT